MILHRYIKKPYSKLPAPYNEVYTSLAESKETWERAYRYMVGMLKSSNRLVTCVCPDDQDKERMLISHPQVVKMREDTTVPNQTFMKMTFSMYIAKEGYDPKSDDKIYFCRAKCRTNKNDGVNSDFSAECYRCAKVKNFADFSLNPVALGNLA